MSYARFSRDSDVYVFEHVESGIECCGCIRGDKLSLRFNSRIGILEHLKEHTNSGDKVPDYCIRRLLEELDDLGDKI